MVETMTSLSDPQIKLRLGQRIKTLRPDMPARWGRMSCHQMLCHVNDSYLACLGAKPVTPAPMHSLQRAVMKWFALYVPLRWPKGVPTRPEVQQGIGGTPPAEFEQDRRDLLATLDRFCTATQRTPHPIFREMSEAEWLRWGYLHADHHLRQFGA